MHKMGVVTITNIYHFHDIKKHNTGRVLSYVLGTCEASKICYDSYYCVNDYPMLVGPEELTPPNGCQALRSITLASTPRSHMNCSQNEYVGFTSKAVISTERHRICCQHFHLAFMQRATHKSDVETGPFCLNLRFSTSLILRSASATLGHLAVSGDIFG